MNQQVSGRFSATMSEPGALSTPGLRSYLYERSNMSDTTRPLALAELRALLVETDECIPWRRSLAGNGYGMVRAYGKMRGAHVVVCTWTHGPKPSGLEVAHSCGMRCCVNPRHLRWATHVDNVAERYTHGTAYFGDQHANSKLTEADIPIIRRRHANGETFMALGREYGVSRTAIRHVVIRQTWRHVA